MTDLDVTPIEIYDTSLRDGNQGEGSTSVLPINSRSQAFSIGSAFRSLRAAGLDPTPKIVNFSQRREMRGTAPSKSRRLAQRIVRTAFLRTITS